MEVKVWFHDDDHVGRQEPVIFPGVITMPEIDKGCLHFRCDYANDIEFIGIPLNRVDRWSVIADR